MTQHVRSGGRAALARAARCKLNGFARSESGSSTVEFALLFPLFIVLLCSSVESGVLMVRQTSLDRAMDIQIRDIRLGNWPPASLSLDTTTAAELHRDLKQRICRNAYYLSDCSGSMMLEMQTVSTTNWEGFTQSAQCVNRADTTKTPADLAKGAPNEMMILRACVLYRPMFARLGLGAVLNREPNSNEYALIAASAFVKEPE